MGEVDPVASERRLRAKRQNERLKLGASFLNTFFLAIVGAALIVPSVSLLEAVRCVWLPAAVILHPSAQSSRADIGGHNVAKV